ncbi:helix-turn-helix domain-containing protein [Streptomyces sp. TRM70350]|uniref:helix-turn-helix domain-containing protein n=1 Tax=Streptomyces sp. TRM70350 TaxID=2856165 RepID=UPI0035A86156
MAASAAVGARHLARLLRTGPNTTPARWVGRVRLDRAQQLDGHSVTSAAHHSGLGSDETLRRALGVLALCPPGSRGLAPHLAALPERPGSSATRALRRLAMHGTRPRDLIGRS